MNLAAWRKRRGLTQGQLACLLGVKSKSLICGLETDRLKPTTDQAIALDRLTGGEVSVATLRPALHDVRVIPAAPEVSA